MKDTTKSDALKAAFEFTGEEYELRRRLVTFVDAVMVALDVTKIEIPLHAYADSDPARIYWTQDVDKLIITRRPEPKPCEHCDGTGLVKLGGEL